MRKHKEILRLHNECGWSIRRIAEVAGASTGTVHNVLAQARRAGLSWPLAADMDEVRLMRVLYPRDGGGCSDSVDYAWVRGQLNRKSVTLKLLWQELCEQQGYQAGSAAATRGGRKRAGARCAWIMCRATWRMWIIRD